MADNGQPKTQGAPAQSPASPAKPANQTGRFLLVYGQPKTGKTVDAMRSFPMAMFTGSPDNFLAAGRLLGYKPVIFNEANGGATTLQANTTALGLVGTGEYAKHRVIVLDDFSLAADASYKAIGKTLANWDLQKEYIRQLDTVLIGIKDAQQRGITVVMNCHAQEYVPPDDKTSRPAKIGRPAMPTEKSSLELVKRATTCLYVRHDPTEKPTPYCYAVGTGANVNGATYLTGDRSHIFRDGCYPLNLAELCRFDGVNIPHWPGTEGIEEPIQYFMARALQVLAQAPPTDLFAPARAQQEALAGLSQALSGAPPALIKYALTTLLHRFRIHRTVTAYENGGYLKDFGL